LILENPDLIKDIAAGLDTKDYALLGDCVEVFTMVAESDDEIIVPYAERLLSFVHHKKTRVRLEAMHGLALVTPQVREFIRRHFNTVEGLFRTDKSIIVRDYALVCAGYLAAGGRLDALVAYPVLKESLTAYETRHAKLGLLGLAQAAPFLKEQSVELDELANLYLQHVKPSVQEAARRLIKVLNADSEK
jgi:hypothetical protein